MFSNLTPALILSLGLTGAGFVSALPAMAQDGPLRIEITDGVTDPVAVAIPKFFGDSEIGEKIRQVVADDLTGTGLFREIPLDAQVSTMSSFSDAVAYEEWRTINSQALVTAEVTGQGEEINVKFRLFDVFAGEPLGDGMQFVARSGDWRRAAHKIADQIYTRLTGESAYFDSRVAFTQESGPKDARIKRIGVMDYDGANILWMTDSSSLVLAPQFSPDGKKIVYTSFESGFPQLQILDVASVSSRPLTQSGHSMAFSPVISPDSRWIAYAQDNGGDTDLWLMDAATGAGRALTDTQGIDTSPSFSPNGKQIVFESDRSGSQQLYVVPLEGGEPARISFGDGRYGDPAWSPKGDMIAFTKQVGDRVDIGVMRSDGSKEQILTDSFLDEGPTWAPNGRVIMFTRVTPGGNGEPRLHAVDITGRNMRPLELNFAASDPSWGPLLP